MSLRLFITGTDTNVGKTYVSVALLKALQQKGYKALGMKPVASGCVRKSGGFYSEDALQLQEASSVTADYSVINPFAFEPAIAPHIAAQRVGCVLNVEQLVKKTAAAFSLPAEVYVIEGAGGWYLPLNAEETMVDFVRRMECMVVLVVGIRLGCINHALLTYKAILASKIPCLGWIANSIVPNVAETPEIIHTLKQRFNIPYWGRF